MELIVHPATSQNLCILGFFWSLYGFTYVTRSSVLKTSSAVVSMGSFVPSVL